MLATVAVTLTAARAEDDSKHKIRRRKHTGGALTQSSLCEMPEGINSNNSAPRAFFNVFPETLPKNNSVHISNGS